MALADQSPECVHLEARFTLTPDLTCAIADDPIANLYLSNALPNLTQTCFRYQFPATLSYETAKGTREVEVEVSGYSGVIANVDQSLDVPSVSPRLGCADERGGTPICPLRR